MNSIKYILWSLSLLLAVSCYEDKGNYDYHPINELIIKGIEEHYDIERQDTLKIQVSLENSLSGGQNLLYAWYFNQNKIANTRDLNYVITEKAKKYSARFEVTDPQNDSVRFFSDFEVVVHSPYSEGLMLLSDCGDHPELSFCSTLNNSKEKILHEVFLMENGKPLRGEALKIEQPSSYYYNGQLFIHTTKVSYRLDPVLCKLIKSYDENSFTEHEPEYDMVYCAFEGAVEDFGVAIGKKRPSLSQTRPTRPLYRKIIKIDTYNGLGRNDGLRTVPIGFGQSRCHVGIRSYLRSFPPFSRKL